MHRIVGIALAGFLLAFGTSHARADDGAVHAVLSPEDVRTYGAMFAAEKAGQAAKSDALKDKLSDESLVGYVLQERYLGAHYKARFGELSSWLKKYDELADADRIYSLALKRAPKKTPVPRPAYMRWRGAKGDSDVFDDRDMDSKAGERAFKRVRIMARGGKPEVAHNFLKTTVAKGPKLPRDDMDRLTAFVASAYLASVKDQEALELAEDALKRGGTAEPQWHWTAGLASYRLQKYDRAATHFEALSQMVGISGRNTAGAAFWAARSWMRAGQPERVLKLYEQAAHHHGTFYGLLAQRLLGKDMGADLSEPELETVSFATLMRNEAAHRAVALWQLGRKDLMEQEMTRAFGEIDPEQDFAFAALARHLGAPTLELRAAETLAERNDVQLTSLYPIPPYEPKGGYIIDRAVVLAFAKQESRFQPSAISSAGARGVMQIMPATAALITRDSSLAKRNKARLNDPVYSMTLGQDYLRQLLDGQNGNLFSLAAAYNAGAGNLSRWMSLHEGMNDPLMFVESVPVPETRNYIKRVMANMWMYRKRFGESADGLDDAAAGLWPVYTQSSTAAAPQ